MVIIVEGDPVETEALYKYDFGDGDVRFTSHPPSGVTHGMTWGWNHGCTNPTLRAVAFPQYKGPIPYEQEESIETGNEKRNLPEIVPMTISTDFLIHVSKKETALDIRVGWPPKVDAEVRELFAQLNIVLPDGARPFNIGAKGGDVSKAKRGLGIEVTFLTPEDLSILPELRRTEKGDRSQICNTRFGLGLLIQGFPITTVTKDTTLV